MRMQVLVFRRAVGSESTVSSAVGGRHPDSGTDLIAVDMEVMTTGLVPFSISELSPGFQLLTRVLMTPKSALGYVATLMPEINNIGGNLFGGLSLLQAGSDLTSYVFKANILSGPSVDALGSKSSSQSCMPGILKLSHNDHEVIHSFIQMS